MRHEARFLAAAALLHAGFLTGTRFVHRPEIVALARSSGRSRPLEVEIALEPGVSPAAEAPTRLEPAPPGAEVQPSPSPRPERAERDRLPMPTAHEPSPAGRATPEPSQNPAAGPPPAASAGPPDAFDPVAEEAPAPRAPGLGGPPVWQQPGMMAEAEPPPPAPTAAPPPRPVDPNIASALLRDGLAAKDKAKGIDSPGAGTVASAVGVAVQESETPPDSRASFEVRVSATGQVLGVRVLSANGGSSDAWKRVAAEIMARLAGRVLAMGAAFAHGALVYVDMSSVDQLPAGAKSTQFNGSGMKFDFSNLGAHRSRVVRTSFHVAALP